MEHSMSVSSLSCVQLTTTLCRSATFLHNRLTAREKIHKGSKIMTMLSFIIGVVTTVVYSYGRCDYI